MEDSTTSNRHFLFSNYDGNGLQIEYDPVSRTLRHSLRTASSIPPEINYGYFFNYSNNWKYITFVWSKPTLKTYVNGVLVNQTSNLGITNLTSSWTTRFGSYGNGNLSHQGKLDDIGIWKRELNECEIKKLYYSPAFTVGASNSIVCAGESLTLTASSVPNYNWSNGANTATTVVTPTASTVYTVSSTYTTGCTDTKTIAVTVNACTGISELTKENTLSIYPNPAKESITITNTNALAGKFYVIHDATGKQVAKGILSQEKTSVSLTGLSAGLYILSLEGKLNQTYKFVKE